MNSKLDWEKDRQKRKPKDANTDGIQPLEKILGRPLVTTPKTTERDARQRLELNKTKLIDKLNFVESGAFEQIISLSKKRHLLKEIEDLIHELRSSTYRSACLANDNPLLRKARSVLKARSSSLPHR
ncbi:MAG: hypothetical protein HZB95_06820 [Nitrosomonadales bacterium]|nr:hypothetical protein [Nitrosomonadales bacterium]